MMKAQGTSGLSALIASANGFMGSFRFIREHGMGWMFVIPALLWIVLSFGLFFLLQGPADQLSGWISAKLAIDMEVASEGVWKDMLAILRGARDLLIVLVLKLAIAYLLFTFNKYIVLIMLSPLLAYASERTEEIISGHSNTFSWSRILKDALRGSLIAIRNGLIEILLSAGVWLFTLIFPIAALFSVAILFAISAYFYGFSMYDYIFERRGMGLKDSVNAVNAHIGMVLMNGALFSLLMKIPLMGMMFAPVMAAVGAVLSMEEELLIGERSREISRF